MLQINCKSCRSNDTMRIQRRMWERKLPIAAYWCRSCGKRFRSTRVAVPEEPQLALLMVAPIVMRWEGRIANPAPRAVPIGIAAGEIEQRIDAILTSLESVASFQAGGYR